MGSLAVLSKEAVYRQKSKVFTLFTVKSMQSTINFS